jgi:vacuolar-type H+-ATPase subunit I/STV1
MFGRRDSIRELIAEMREESNRRDEEVREEAKRRDEESKRRDEEMREFNREILLRNEKVYTSVIVQLEENTEQTRANTKAVLSLLDRFNGSDGLAA